MGIRLFYLRLHSQMDNIAFLLKVLFSQIFLYVSQQDIILILISKMVEFFMQFLILMVLVMAV